MSRDFFSSLLFYSYSYFALLFQDLLRKVLVLMNSTHTFLVLGALRVMRKIIALKDEFYNRYIIKGKLFIPVIEAFFKNNGR